MLIFIARAASWQEWLPGDFEKALIALLGKDAGGLSDSTLERLKEAWPEEHERWSKRNLLAQRYVYFWVDGIHVQVRLEGEAQCLLVNRR